MTHWAPKYYAQTTSTGTVVVIHIINTDVGTTRISTIAKNVPPGFVPPPTNFGGTRTATATYTRHGREQTTGVTYPTPFLKLPDAYTVSGDYDLGSPSATSQSLRCVRKANQAYNIPVNWQPAWNPNHPTWNLTQMDYDPTDELGWSYSYLETSNYTSLYNIQELIDVIPDDNPNMPHSVVKACVPDLVPQPYAIEANPNWKVVGSKSVRYEGTTPTLGARAMDEVD
ncbi:hypothetical protein B0T14DRAFT_563668 [Immersiella caudata]|uniref:Uncharacterized protein n=1 Tax=Immersiella caudata TaxID=314043 RepID=A0AA39X5Z8_9PEZI|nr:hypothetical protein B0T14DRAFT_563668 [Immersiella caudata]